MKRIICVFLVSVSALGQAKPEPKSVPEPTFTKEPMYQMVPHCPEGFEPWYEPSGGGCSSWQSYIGARYLDRKIDSEPIKPEDVECRPVGSAPKAPAPTTCPV